MSIDKDIEQGMDHGRDTHDHDLTYENEQSTVTIPLKEYDSCLLYTSPSPRDVEESRMPSSA